MLQMEERVGNHGVAIETLQAVDRETLKGDIHGTVGACVENCIVADNKLCPLFFRGDIEVAPAVSHAKPDEAKTCVGQSGLVPTCARDLLWFK